MSDEEDLYQVLGVAKDASPADIKKAFRALARECHPDVAGADPEKEARFKRIREAYEVLADPIERGRYDRRGDRRATNVHGGLGTGYGSSSFTQFWSRVNGTAPEPPGPGNGSMGGDLGLEDIFSDFAPNDFGFGGQGRKAAASSSGARTRAEAPHPGRDIGIAVDVPGDVAARGGTVGVRYQRLRRGEDGRTLYRYDELHDLKVPPETPHGGTLRVSLMGDAGLNGGPYGDLVCDIRLVGRVRPSDRMKMPPRPEKDEPGSRAHDEDVVIVNIGIAEALLGGRVSLDTPGGQVRLVVPPCTSSGTRLRLKAKGFSGADGVRRDLFAEIRIVVPSELDDESKRLISRFAELNPSIDER